MPHEKRTPHYCGNHGIIEQIVPSLASQATAAPAAAALASTPDAPDAPAGAASLANAENGAAASAATPAEAPAAASAEAPAGAFAIVNDWLPLHLESIDKAALNQLIHDTIQQFRPDFDAAPAAKITLHQALEDYMNDLLIKAFEHATTSFQQQP